MTTTDPATQKLEVARSHTQEAAQDAKARAAAVGSHAHDAAEDVAGTAMDRAREVKDETVRQAHNLASDATEQLSAQASEQTRRISANLHDLGHELRQMADAGNGGAATELAHQASERAQQVAGYLDGREPAEILDDLRALARRRPGAFLAGAAVLGLVAGRLGRGLKDAGPSPRTTQRGRVPVPPYPSEPPRVAPPSERPPVFYGDERPVELSGPDYQSDLVQPTPYGGPEVQR
ncbi:MAG: hypothetical protein QOJ11_797 [Frankiales bacterium]|nr:hypothetical protein [Frankiales bacterium]